MKYINLGNTGLQVPALISGCMRHAEKTPKEMAAFIHTAMDHGINYFDHADIYGKGMSETVFGQALASDPSLKREDMIIQSKCGIRPGIDYDSSKDYILNAVDGILERLQVEYLDLLLIHRPDALVEPEEVAEAFEQLEKSGKVRRFGVSNHNPMAVELLKTCVKQDLVVNQLQFSIPVANMVASGMESNMTSPGSVVRDGSVLDYSRINRMTIQAWSPFQMPEWRGTFIGAPEYEKLNREMKVLADKYDVSMEAIATAWILRHPAKMQVILGTASEERLKKIVQATEIQLTREEWYRLYLAAGYILP